MSEIDQIQKLLAEGLVMLQNANNPTMNDHKTLLYVDSATSKLREAGVLVHALTPNLADMIQFAHEYIPEQYHGTINHAWSGIGDWQA
jgi:hypothetical protein